MHVGSDLRVDRSLIEIIKKYVIIGLKYTKHYERMVLNMKKCISFTNITRLI
ncbi:hypothetical protein HanIR_Chr09g0425311 [Helianthus annuus]|nr:hypothetical protein HanIR_Chr09g0425311 [Helianthus annuus]